MIKINTDPDTITILRLFDDFATAEGASLQDVNSHESFIKKIAAAFARHRENPIAVYGLRVQSMFAYVAAALGECEMITEEDAGLFLAANKELRRPDFHIVTRQGAKFFVEVKSHSPNDPMEPFEMKDSYLARLEKYAELSGRELKIAVYWRHLEMWTLVGSKFFDFNGHRFSLSLEAAFKRSEMSLLGDCMVGTVAPLAMRFYTDPDTPRKIDSNGKVTVNFKRIDILVNGQVIEDPQERSIALFLFMHGRWNDLSKPADVKDGELIWFDLEAAPTHSMYQKQGFDLIGSLSEMISSQYRYSTLKDGQVSTLSPNGEPSALGVLIPADYQGKVLRLWRLIQQPNYDDLVSRGK